MNWLNPAIIITSIGTAILALVYLFIYRSERKEYLKIWTIAWALYLSRFLAMFVMINTESIIVKNIATPLNQLFALFSSYLLLRGTLMLTHRKLKLYWKIPFYMVVIWVVVSVFYSSDIMLISLPNFIYIGIVFLYIAYLFYVYKEWPILERRLISVLFFIWGLHKFDYPFLRPVEWFAPIGYALSGVLAFGVAISIILVYLETNKSNLLVSQKKYKQIVENARTAILNLDLDLNITYMNEYAENIFGYKLNEVLNKNVLGTIIPVYDSEGRDMRGLVDNIIRNFENHVSVDNQNKTKDGKRLWMSWKNQRLFDENQQHIGFISIGTDITDRVNAQKALKREVEVNEALVVISKEIMAPEISVERIAQKVRDLSMKLTEATHGFVSSIDQFTGDNVIYTFTEMMPAKKEEKVLLFQKSKYGYPSLWGFPLNEREGFFTNEPEKHEASNGTPKGHIKLENFLSVPAIALDRLVGQIALANKTGGFTDEDLEIAEKVARIYAIAIYRYQMQQELVQEKERAQESDRLKSAFLANMSHEIRTPMNGIIGFARIMAMSKLDEDRVKKYAKIVVKSSERLLRIINDIIDISKIEAGEIKIEFEIINIPDTINDVIQLHKLRAEVKKIKLYTDIQLEPREAITKNDSNRLIQVLHNLISNAIKFTPDGEICVGCKVEESNYIFSVKDTGIGIPKEDQAKIFERFVQVQNSYMKDSEGTGLGLSISKAFIERMGGKIWIESEKGKGAAFYFSLPFSIAQTGNMNHGEARTSLRNGESFDFIRNKTLIIAEDEDVNFGYLNELLIPHKVKVLRARNGKEAVDIINETDSIDAILMDIKMPVMNGLEATVAIKKKKPFIPIIAQTAYAMSTDKSTALHYGCDDYIDKPIQPDILFSMLRKYIA